MDNKWFVVNDYGEVLGHDMSEMAAKLLASENEGFEALCSDDDDWVCPECGNSCEAIYTISEWCEEKGFEGDESYLYELADKQGMSTDICEDCFDALVYAAGL